MVITGAFNTEGGIATSNRLAIHALNEAGYGLTVLALNEAFGSEHQYKQVSGIRYRAFAGDKVKFTLAVWRAAVQMRSALIFCDHINLASILMPLAAIRMLKYAVRLHGIEVWPPLPDVQGRLGLLAAWRRLSSTYTQERVLEQFPNLNVTVCDLSLGSNQNISPMLAPPPANTSFTAVDGVSRLLGTRVLLHVGRMAENEQYKGQDTLIQAMPDILAKCPEAQVVLVGKGDDSPRLLELAWAQPREVQSAIFMPGYVPDETLDWLYSHCYLFVMPSRGEGFGFVYLEAMRWGKPCIGSRVDAARCIIRDGETGLLVADPSDPAELVESVLNLLNAPELAARMGLAGRKYVQDNYTFAHFKVRFLKALTL